MSSVSAAVLSREDRARDEERVSANQLARKARVIGLYTAWLKCIHQDLTELLEVVGEASNRVYMDYPDSYARCILNNYNVFMEVVVDECSSTRNHIVLLDEINRLSVEVYESVRANAKVEFSDLLELIDYLLASELTNEQDIEKGRDRVTPGLPLATTLWIRLTRIYGMLDTASLDKVRSEVEETIRMVKRGREILVIYARESENIGCRFARIVEEFLDAV